MNIVDTRNTKSLGVINKYRCFDAVDKASKYDKEGSKIIVNKQSSKDMLDSIDVDEAIEVLKEILNQNNRRVLEIDVILSKNIYRSNDSSSENTQLIQVNFK